MIYEYYSIVEDFYKNVKKNSYKSRKRLFKMYSVNLRNFPSHSTWI